VRFASLIVAALLQGCVYLPHTTTVYDEQCKIETKHMTLRPEQIGAVGSCSGRDCLVALAAIGVIAAGTAIVSGSIVVVGNVVYWIEKQGRCALA
jgi:hypothetical protein